MSFEIVQLSNQNRIKAVKSEKNAYNQYNKPKSYNMKSTDAQIGKLKREFGYNLDITNVSNQNLKWCCQ